ncbi:uncharacterized protein LOC134260939 [Saccostrea cucullata]|uniref:uncharacterized protein LOC134260939 n=1 Tax=Saccostrea cuccullata TaxID=36930 RepID=UPI002ED3AA9F
MTRIKYQEFGHIVYSCPRNETEFLASATRLSCDVDGNGRYRYVCVPNNERSAIVEFCYNYTSGLYEKGNCLIVYENGFLDQVSCLDFRKGCPADPFFFSDLYKYPACHEINQQEKCFYADPACQNTTITTESLFSSTTVTTEETASFPTSTFVAITLVSLLSLLFIIAILFYVFRKRKGNLTQITGVSHDKELLMPDIEPSGEEDESESDTHEECLNQLISRYLGDYNVWKTKLSDEFQKMSGEEVAMLFSFLCSDTGCPNFNDRERLGIFNHIRKYCDMETKSSDSLILIRHKCSEKDFLSSEEAYQILDKLKATEFLYEDQNEVNITEDAADETMYCIVQRSVKYSVYKLFLFSFTTTLKYFRTRGYHRKPREKCLISGSSQGDKIIIHRLQMNILTHITMEDKNIFPYVFQILNIPDAVSNKDGDERKTFITDLEKKGEILNYSGKSQSQAQVKWFHRFWRPAIVRSCVGNHPHMDIYIINNKAYKVPSRYHSYSWDIKSLLYSILFLDNYTFKVSDISHKTLLKEIRGRYYATETISEDFDSTRLPNDCVQTQYNTVTFISDDIRHDVMYAFVTECLVEDSDLEFFLTTASRDVISEYCRSWNYKRKEKERCIYIPNRHRDLYGYFIDKLQLDIIKHCTVSDQSIRSKICECLKVPEEILHWDQRAREQYVECASQGTHTVHHARGMIVGCAQAGKTTLLKRLMGCSKREILNVTPTEGLEVHEKILEICEENDTKFLKATSLHENGRGVNVIDNHKKTLSFFDFGGQCAYYACHQIYLTRRAFYIIVVDASKKLDEKVNENVCDQKGTLFSEWIYGDYFLFWLKSIHTYCGAETGKTLQRRIIIVATHWDNKQYKNETKFLEALQSKIPRGSHLLQYIQRKSCFFIKFSLRRDNCSVFTRFYLEPLDNLKEHIIEIISEENWEVKIPREWALLDIKFNQRRAKWKILREQDIEMKTQKDSPQDNTKRQTSKKNMLRYFHDAGKVLYFNEEGLEDSVIIDIQWFVDAFKNIITDKLNLDGIFATRSDWEEYYHTGYLKDCVLEAIWKHKDEQLDKQLTKHESLEDSDFPDDEIFFDVKDQSLRQTSEGNQPNQYFQQHRKSLLNVMDRLGLIATGSESHYIPCMNRKEFDEETQRKLFEIKNKSSILVFQFNFLPYFFFFRLVVACMHQDRWIVRKNQNLPCLYRNAALFSFHDHHIAIAVTVTSIQLQVYQPISSQSLDLQKTKEIQSSVEEMLYKISATFDRKIDFEKGFSCKNENEQSIGMDIEEHFIPEKEIILGEEVVCPVHHGRDLHTINTEKLTKYWKIHARSAQKPF